MAQIDDVWKELLAENKAKTLPGYDDEHASRLGDEERRRCWEITASREFALLLCAKLDAYTSAKNGSPSGSVSDPTIDGQTVPGTYRGIRTYRIRNPRGDGILIVQGLRKGFATAFTDAEWRLVGASVDPATGVFKFTREHRNMNIAAWDDQVTALKSVATLTDPYASGEKYTGTFAAVTHEPVKEEDGSLTIRQTLTQLQAPADVAALKALTYRVREKDTILLPETTYTGLRKLRWYTWEGLNPSAETACLGITAADLVSNFPGAGWVYADRDFEKQRDGTATFVVYFEQFTWSDTATEASAQVTEVRAAVDGSQALAIREWSKRSATAKDALIATGPPLGLARTGFTWNTVAYTHLTYRVTEHKEDKSWTVLQIGVVPKYNAISDIWPETVGAFTMTYTRREDRRIVKDDGYRQDQYRNITLTEEIRMHSTYSAAHAALGAGPLAMAGGIVTIGKHRYLSRKLTESYGSWTNY
ncbi:MAG: hypothetical protein FJ276_21800 [Planctomycetes bacterium]|nr:hypothetical protein [Planctomycetota bacterium]